MINNGCASICFGASKFLMVAFTVLVFVLTYLNTMSRTKQELLLRACRVDIAARSSSCKLTGDSLSDPANELAGELFEKLPGESFGKLSAELSIEVATQLHTHG